MGIENSSRILPCPRAPCASTSQHSPYSKGPLKSWRRFSRTEDTSRNRTAKHPHFTGGVRVNLSSLTKYPLNGYNSFQSSSHTVFESRMHPRPRPPRHLLVHPVRTVGSAEWHAMRTCRWTDLYTRHSNRFITSMRALQTIAGDRASPGSGLPALPGQAARRLL